MIKKLEVGEGEHKQAAGGQNVEISTPVLITDISE